MWRAHPVAIGVSLFVTLQFSSSTELCAEVARNFSREELFTSEVHPGNRIETKRILRNLK
jgi:hypothetical protein